MNIIYRKLLPYESPSYRAIRLESLKKFPQSFGASYEESVQTEKLKLETDIENQDQERFVFGAFDTENLIGICAFIKGENNTGNIYQMYVKDHYQGKNIGFELIRTIIAEANQKFNNPDIFLEVIPSNTKAYHLYKRFGFEEIPQTSQTLQTDTNVVMKYIKN